MALDGKAWAEKVLRHEDMQIYTYRLLLEYARISDDNRDLLGVAEDLVRLAWVFFLFSNVSTCLINVHLPRGMAFAFCGFRAFKVHNTISY